MRRMILGTLVTCALVLGAPAAAEAALTVVGSTTLPSGGATSICGGSPCTVLQAQAASNYVLSSPVAGMIVSWSFRSANASAGNVYALRVLRPNGSGFTATGSSSAPPLADGNDEVRGPYTTSIAVQPGDRIGLASRGPSDFGVPVVNTGASGDGVSFFSPDISDGATATPTSAGTGQQVLVQATIQYATAPGCPPTCPPPPPRPSLALSRPKPAVFHAAPFGPVVAGASLGRHVHVNGTQIIFTTNQDATVHFVATHKRVGRDFIRSATCQFAVAAHSGLNKFIWTGRVLCRTRRGRFTTVRLSPRRRIYWLSAVATNVNGSSPLRHVKFKITR